MRVRELLLWTVLVVLAGVLIWVVLNRPAGSDRVAFNEFLRRVDSGAVAYVVITDNTIVATTKSKDEFVTELPPGVNVIPRLIDHHVAIDVKSGSSAPWVGMLGFYTSTILPWFALALVLVALARVRSLEKRLEASADRERGAQSRNE